MLFFELKAERESLLSKADGIIKAAETATRELTASESAEISAIQTEVRTKLNPQIKRLEDLNTIRHIDPVAFMGGGRRDLTTKSGRVVTPDGEAIAHYMIHSRLPDDYAGGMTADTPLHTDTSGVGLLIPAEVLSREVTYLSLDSFVLAGSTMYATDHIHPLKKPVISAGAAFDALPEGTGASQSKPFAVSGFVFGAQKFSRLVRVSEEALLASALDLQAEVLAELSASVINTLTAVASTALMSALDGNLETYIPQGSDPYSSLQALLHAVPIRYDIVAECAWMMSRHDLFLIKNSRTTFGQPLFNSDDNTIFGRKVVLNDGLNRVVYGNWRAGSYLRRTPFFLLPLRELYSALGEWGFKGTIFADQQFMASVPSVTVQPLYFTNLETPGS